MKNVIKSEIFHSFFELLYRTKPLVIDLDKQKDINLQNLVYKYSYMLIIIEYSKESEELVSPYCRHIRRPLLTSGNHVFINKTLLNDPTQEDLDDIIHTLQDISSESLELFATASDLETFSKQLEKNKQELIDKLEKFKTSSKDEIKCAYQKQIDSAYSDYMGQLAEANRYYTKYKALLEKQALAMSQEQSIYVDLVDFIKRNRLLQCGFISFHNDGKKQIQIKTTPFNVEYSTNEEPARRLIYNNSTFVGTSDEIKNMLFDAITSRDKYKLLHNAVTIYIDLENDIIKSYYMASYDIFNREWTTSNIIESNEHWFHFQCRGSFAADLMSAQVSNNIKQLVALILQYLATINLADTAGVNWINRKQHIVKDIENNKILKVNARNNEITDITELYENYINLKNRDFEAYAIRDTTLDRGVYIDGKI